MKNDKWNSLSIKDKANLMKLYIKNGINNLEEIRGHYNKFATGGYIEEKDIQKTIDKVNASKANFVERLKDPNREFIKDWASDAIATHKLGVATDSKGNHYIYPEVQEIEGKLVDFTRPPYAKWAGMKTAEERGDTVRVNSIEEGLKFTENYKKYYPTFNKFEDGGKKNILGVPYRSLNSSDYDYFNASPSNMPRNKEEHWTSRNEDGRILKGNNHPTLDLALNIEGLLGNRIYKNVDGTYSSYEEGQFPTSLGVRINNNRDISPLDPSKRFRDIQTTKGRKYNEDNMLYISDMLNNTLLNDVQKNAILGSIIEESGGNPFAIDETGRFKGLLQWEDSRYSPDNSKSKREELDNQLLYLMETLYNINDKKSWTHGGKGSGYKSAKHAKETFFNTNDLYKATHSLNRGYIRPTGGDYSVKNRYKVAKQLK